MLYCHLTPGSESTKRMSKSAPDSTNRTVKSGKDSTNRHSPQLFGRDSTTLTSISDNDVTTRTSKSAALSTIFTFPRNGIPLQVQVSRSIGSELELTKTLSGSAA